MGSQLNLWTSDDTRLGEDRRLVLTIRESRRARRLILQAVPPRTVEVVVPRGTRSGSVRAFIDEHRGWIDRAGAELLAAYPETDLRPAVIELAGCGESVAVSYFETDSAIGSYRYRPGRLDLYAPVGAPDAAARALRAWLLEQGRRRLKPWLERESARTGLAPTAVQIRLQRTRWGSCSSRGRISLNAALLLVAPELVRYLLVHELCHLQHLSHSRRYWASVAGFEPAYRALDRRLAESWRELPAWVFELTAGSVAC